MVEGGERVDDAGIIELFFARDGEAVAECRRAYGAYCLGIARRILPREADAEECENDVYMAAWRAIPPERPASLRAFLGKITRNLALDRYEREHAQKRGGGAVDAVLDELSECLPGPGSAGERLEAAELAGAVDAFLRSRTPRERQIFLRRVFFCDGVAEIAARFSTSEAAVKSSLRRTRAALRRYLEREELL